MIARALFLILLLPLPLGAQEATLTAVEILRVVDGDTWDVRASLPIGISFEARLRPLGLDCVEPQGDDREEGLQQARALEDLLFSAETHELKLHGRDSFGRWLVEAWADSINVAEYMLENGCETWP